jgi:hypothetical protein
MLSLWPLVSNSRMSNWRFRGTCTPEKQERTQRPSVVPRETPVPIRTNLKPCSLCCLIVISSFR